MELVKFRHNWNGNSYNTMDINDFVNALDTCIEDKRMYGDNEETDFYEHTGSMDYIVCGYFDYDEYVSKDIWDKLFKKDGDEYGYVKYENFIKNSVCEWFPETLRDCATMRNHRIVNGKDGIKYKFSYRLNYYNIVCYKHEFKDMVCEIQKKITNLDTSVYDIHKKMRCVFTAKPETPDYPMELVEGTTEQTLIHHYCRKNYEMFRLKDFCKYNDIDLTPFVFEGLPTKKNETNLNIEDDTTTNETMSVNSETELMSVPNMENWDILDKLIWCCKGRFETGKHRDYVGIIQAIRNSYNAKESELLCQKYTLLYGSENKKNEFNNWYKSVKKHTGSEKLLSIASIHYWAKNDNPNEYIKLFPKKKNSDNDNVNIIQGDEKGAMDFLWNKTYKERLKYCNGEYYMKVDNKWLNSTKEITGVLNSEILNANLYKEKEKTNGETELVPYSNKRKNAVDIGKCILDKCMVEKDDNFINNFSKTNKNKLCFKNGVLDLTNKKFSSWEDNQDIYTTIIIPYNYVEERNENDIEKVNNLIKSIFNTKWEEALKFYARALGGNIQDKIWSIFMGTRNCGKGVIEALLRATFCDYIGSASSSYFVCKQNKEADVKDMGWVQDIQFNRLIMIQEFQHGEKTLVNGTTIKSFSGGDIIENRKNFQDAVKTLPEGTLMFLNNSMPKYAKKTEDCIKNCMTFSSINQYVSQDRINQAIEEKQPESYINTLKLGDNDIKEKVKSNEYRNAFIHLIADYWFPNAVDIVNDFKEDEDENAVDYGKLICKSFVKTDNKKDKMSVSLLKQWCCENQIEYAKQLKPYLLAMGCVEKKIDGIMTFKFIKNIENININYDVDNED